ncbi:MAG: adenosylcobalamin-dependent ribonucleoside-diphosphate reductase [Planctomycetota bacterium]
MKITRKFTKQGSNPFDTVEWTTRSSRIGNPDGTVVFEMADAEVPKGWSQLATDIMVSKYFRKAGVPQTEQPYAVPGESAIKIEKDGSPVTGPERSARQVIHRLAGCWRHWGEGHGYFDTAEDAQAFYDELVYMMVHQMAAPNSPQWFNTGLNFAYGISGPAQGHWVVDAETGEAKLADDAYSHPQPHACFIQSVGDDLVNEGGIMDLWVREARLFKYGSGTGTNFSKLRGANEQLSGGGKSSGLMSWLKIGDRAAGAIKSGGTTRRAAKMVCLDLDHPDIREFVNWKVREELKVKALVEGLKHCKEHDESVKETAERIGLELDYDFNGESYQTVSGQNSNNSVRIPDSFFDAIDADAEWGTTFRTTGEAATAFPARQLWDEIGYAAWRCADPGVQYDTTINAWHTCPSAGRINASNPCSEYMFLDNTACNLASLNLLKFYDPEARSFDVERYEHAVDVWTIVLEISVLMAAFPSKEIAERSYNYRTLGLGYANLGAMLMQAGVPYDSDHGRATAGMLTAILTGRSYRQSALMAKEHGPFPGYRADRDSMLRVMRNHRRAARGVARGSGEYEDLRITPVPIDHALVEGGKVPFSNSSKLLQRSIAAWDEAVDFGVEFGYRNAQTTVIAPTGTIGLLMDCDTTGVEPDFALVKFKKLAGGGYFKIANDSLEPSLRALGYTADEVRDILHFILGTLSLETEIDGLGVTLRGFLADKGLPEKDLAAIEASLPGVFELGFAFTGWSVSDEGLKALGFDPDEARADHAFNLLRKLGLDAAQIAGLNKTICGTQTIEGAPYLKDEHLPVFDCANKCGPTGQRYIAAEGHIRMMAAAQPFISGAISKTINLPAEASVEDIKDCYRLSWELGIKANALYRDGCKLSQPLSTKSDVEEESDAETEGAVAEAEAEASDEIAGHVAKVASAVSDEDAAAAAEETVRIVHRPMRRRLPDTRRSVTHKFNIAGHEGYLTVGLYEDGLPGELFITMAKEGSTIGGLMDSLGTATSVALQYGVPVESLVKKFTHQRFEPAGMTTNREIPFAKSLVDYIFRWMGFQFIPGYKEQNAPNRDGGSTTTKPTTTPSSKHTTRASETPGEQRWNTSQSRPIGSVQDTAGPHSGPHAGPIAGRIGTQPASEPVSGLSVEGTSALVAEVKPEAVGVSRDALKPEAQEAVQSSALSAAMEANMGDAPPCDTCGEITVRNGTCYRCLNCGASMGCS